MPCTYEESPEEKRISFERSVPSSDAYKAVLKKMDTLTKLLCKACEIIDNSEHDFPPDLGAWFVSHKAEDKVRLKREALAKLSKEEREALGLK